MRSAPRRPRGRYAPSPTGELHLGNASTALLAWASIRARNGSFVMRCEDLDRNRVREELAGQILDDLGWLGLDWDEGPDCGGPHEPYEQWKRLERYARAVDRLRERGRLYPCFCSRADIHAAASAPQQPGDELRYPGTCRDLDPEESERRIAAGRRHALRFRVDPSDTITFRDQVHGAWGHDRPVPGDFVVRRADGVPAYQLAVVVDDAAMGIDEVVRGDDLLESTVRQLLLYRELEQPAPGFAHVPLLLGPDGARLSKRHEGVTIRQMREAGLGPKELVGRLAQCLGLRVDCAALSAGELAAGFALSNVPPRPDGITIDVRSWLAS